MAAEEKEEGKRLRQASRQLAQRHGAVGSLAAGSGRSGMAGSASFPPSGPTAYLLSACLTACLPPQPAWPCVTHSTAAAAVAAPSWPN